MGCARAEPDSAPVTVAEPNSLTSLILPQSGENSIGLVGCSMTVGAADGYRQVGGVSLWPGSGLGYGRGTVHRWAQAGSTDLGFWESFATSVERHGRPEAVWWQLCTSGVHEDDLGHALAVLEEIEGRLPGVSVFVSAQPDYTDGHVCASASPGGPEAMQLLVEALVESGRVMQGPVLSPLDPSRLVDSCHADDAGERDMGRELLEFFG